MPPEARPGFAYHSTPGKTILCQAALKSAETLSRQAWGNSRLLVERLRSVQVTTYGPATYPRLLPSKEAPGATPTHLNPARQEVHRGLEHALMRCEDGFHTCCARCARHAADAQRHARSRLLPLHVGIKPSALYRCHKVCLRGLEGKATSGPTTSLGCNHCPKEKREEPSCFA